MSTLKSVIPLMLSETLNVSVAVVTWPALSVVPSLFHVSVMGPFAFAGFQFILVMLNVSWVLPVFLT